jgi:hypothetical protein
MEGKDAQAGDSCFKRRLAMPLDARQCPDLFLQLMERHFSIQSCRKRFMPSGICLQPKKGRKIPA